MNFHFVMRCGPVQQCFQIGLYLPQNDILHEKCLHHLHKKYHDIIFLNS